MVEKLSSSGGDANGTPWLPATKMVLSVSPVSRYSAEAAYSSLFGQNPDYNLWLFL
jgi:hypothetical protein